MQLDEVLTVSAKMCAATGRMDWQERYDKHAVQLDAAIEEAQALVPPSDPDASQDISAVNARLVEMERQAFRLASQGRREEAADLLESEQYTRDKRNYSKATQDRVDAMSQEVQESLTKQRWQSRSTIAGAIVVM